MGVYLPGLPAASVAGPFGASDLLYALILYVCASSEPCEAPESDVMMATRGMSLEECANNGTALATAFAPGKYFVARCLLEARRS